MRPVDRRSIMLGGALFGLAGLGALARPPRPSRRPGLQQELESAMPREVSHYRPADPAGVVLPRADDLSREIYDGFLARAYTDGESPAIFVVLAYGSVQDYALQLHRPEICYPASGYTIGPVADLALDLGKRKVPACTMAARLGRREDRVLWWTRMASAFPTTVWQERREILAAAIRREVPDGMLVRFSTAGSPRSVDRLGAFAHAFVGALPNLVSALLIGDPV